MSFSPRVILIAILWLASHSQQSAMAKSIVKDASMNSPADDMRGVASTSIAEEKNDNDRLIKVWEDWVLANLIVVNYLNTLAVIASRADFPFTVPPGYSVQHVQSVGSFRQTILQLTTEMRNALSSAREDLNRVYTGMERVPGHLKTIVVLLKQAPLDLLLSYLPDSFHDIEKLVNDSLVVLAKPEKSFRQVLNLLTEINHLLQTTSTSQIVQLQAVDVKTHWADLTNLIIELAKLAGTTSNSLLLQFNWILAEFSRPELASSDANRDFLISLILRKIVEIDQASDLLAAISKAYTDLSFKFTDEQIGGNAHLLLLTSEEVRKRYLKEFRYDLVPQAVQGARIVRDHHLKFLQRDRNRKTDYDKFLAGTSLADLVNLLG